MEAGPLPPIDLEQYSGILVGGSPFTSSDPPDSKSEIQLRVEAELRALLDRVVAADFPFFGACYGVGTLGAHQGAVIDRAYGEPIGPVSISVTRQGRADPLLEGLPDTFDAYVGHKEACRSLPPGAVLLATSAGCPVQMFRIRNNLYATQFHPELDVVGILTRVDVYRDAGYFPPETAEELMAAARSAVIPHPPRIVRNFVARYARP